MIHQAQTYADLRKQIHDDLRIQHPEWVQPNGESPLCDSYEARLMETLDVLIRQRPSISYDCDRLRYNPPQEALSVSSLVESVAAALRRNTHRHRRAAATS